MISILISIICSMGFTMSNTVFAETLTGTVTSLSGNADITGTENVTVKYDILNLKWYPADPSLGRYENGWWLGIRITPPTSLSGEALKGVKFQTYGRQKTWSGEKDFYDSTADEGHQYLSSWSYIDTNFINEAKKAGQVEATLGKIRFDWNKDGAYEQNVTIVINVNNTELSLESGDESKTPVVVTIKDGDYSKNFTLTSGQSLNDLTPSAKSDLEAIKQKEGKTFLGFFDETDKEVKETDPINSNITLTAKFKDIEVAQTQTEEKDETYKTGIINVKLISSIVAIITLFTIVLL